MFRNSASNAIIIKNDAKFAEYKMKKERALKELKEKQKLEQRISNLESNITEIKNSLNFLIKRLTNGN